jgi:hypothetical protein
MIATPSAHTMLRPLLLMIALLAGPVWSAEGTEQQVRYIEAAIGRINQEQQSLYQQFNMVQELRRNDERQLGLPGYTVPPSTNYDEARRQEAARTQRLREHQYELDRLYARYRELEDQKRDLLQTLSSLAQQSSERGNAASENR